MSKCLDKKKKHMSLKEILKKAQSENLKYKK